MSGEDALPQAAPDGESRLRQRFRKVAEQDILGHAVPKAFGGLGDGFGELYKAHRLLGRACRDPGLVLAVNAHLWGAVFPLLQHGSEDQKQELLPRLISGEWLAGHAITEPSGGSDVRAMATRAEPVAEGFRLSGEKRYITNVPLADWLVVYARLQEGISAFLVSAQDAGCRMTQDGAVRACRGSATGSVLLDGCLVGFDRLLGKAGAGGSMIQRALELERSFVFAGIAGVMEWQLEQVVTHSRERRSRGVHLGHHQAISHRIADMKLRLDTIDLWLRECVRLCEAGQRISLVSAQTKLFASEAFLQSSLDAVQILGAKGLEQSGSGMQELVLDAMAGRLFSGSSEIQKNIIAALLGTGEGFRGKGR